ncbi:CPBP family intramembrane metalloprotease [Halorarum halophilum]|uniref:CPBP family intramembrane metalloprotease n=1 Tax=Halorarum halophilum TaxID=2743090 RepID=A0A7D5GES7_9EURY|nr:CPBP family intramembrane glutamic endopeptidase [Halobaculum halophilum]QLG27648.1 CPBP family intramembrane metalloprotease [Halobaculum halophilum]
MLRTDTDPPTFESGSLVPVATYLLVIAVLSGLTLVSAGTPPPPLLAVGWSAFLVVLAIGVLKIEDVSPRSILPPARTLIPVIGVLVAFWALYNLVAFALALGGVHGFEATRSRTAIHPLSYLLALLSSFLITAIPEELVFRSYLQQKLIALIGGQTRHAVVSSIVIVAVLFALFHLPRWFLASGHGVSVALVGRLVGLTLMGLTYGVVYALTRNLWLVALFHATMNHPPVLVTVSIPSDLHLVAAVIEYAAIISVVYLTVRVTEPDRTTLVLPRQATASSMDD